MFTESEYFNLSCVYFLTRYSIFTGVKLNGFRSITKVQIDFSYLSLCEDLARDVFNSLKDKINTLLFFICCNYKMLACTR
jgi:hypothetical protein